MKERTSYPVNVLVPLICFLIFGVPTAMAVSPFLATVAFWPKVGFALLAPFIYLIGFVLISAFLSLPFQASIIPGKFPRNVQHIVYGPRRLYGLCWGALFYFTPIYYLVLSMPKLRKTAFHAFGYRGSQDVNIAPDAWIRDLPLLNFSEGVYVANKSTIGTNICLASGDILVDQVTLGSRALIGHLAMIAPGARIGDRAEIGVGSAIGIRARLGSETKIGPTTSINHGAEIGNRVDVGAASYIGIKARIGDGLRIPGGSNIPGGLVLDTQEAVQKHTQAETQAIRAELSRLNEIYSARSRPASAAAGYE